MSDKEVTGNIGVDVAESCDSTSVSLLAGGISATWNDVPTDIGCRLEELKKFIADNTCVPQATLGESDQQTYAGVTVSLQQFCEQVGLGDAKP